MSSPEFVPRSPELPNDSILAGSQDGDRVRSSFWSHSARVAVFWALCDTLCVLVAAAAAVRVYLGKFTSDDFGL